METIFAGFKSRNLKHIILRFSQLAWVVFFSEKERTFVKVVVKEKQLKYYLSEVSVFFKFFMLKYFLLL